MPFAELRSRICDRAVTVFERLGALTEVGRVARTYTGYRLAGR